VHGSGMTAAEQAAVEGQARAEIEERERRFKTRRAALELSDCTVIVVDDGLATGATMRAAVLALRAHGPREIWVAVPVGPPDVVRALREVADEVVCLDACEGFVAVGYAYDDFEQVDDTTVSALLATRTPAV
jgi:putative phosphoribosyl transferase